ncbi:MAG: hypothetical protein R2991_14675 [Thermoanaerobaculia bacterium]
MKFSTAPASGQPAHHGELAGGSWRRERTLQELLRVSPAAACRRPGADVAQEEWKRSTLLHRRQRSGW